MHESFMDAKPVIAEIVVVEGIHDKQRVLEAVDADVIVLGGDRLGYRVLQLLRKAAANRGVIVLTDPDGPGERIRRRIDQSVPGCKHAYISRADAASPAGLGVEHACAQAVRAALLSVRPIGDEWPKGTDRSGVFTQADLLAHGLLAHPDAANRRRIVGEALGIGYGNAKAFLHKLNAVRITEEEFKRAVERLR
ncbi:ribonuclease M5 [Alicyclobacillus acidiphilus]|uniref:ribonuclease M5 n=1 Tax=Alicyclobacillus acidiphilus TaxID=182455 RepID=UPI000A4B5E5A|nr:ribonuclease M5 [Alicyclobacillus acidiphilus]